MTISVTQLNNYIRGLFDIDGVLNNVSVCGEVTNLKIPRRMVFFAERRRCVVKLLLLRIGYSAGRRKASRSRRTNKLFR